MQGSSEYKLFQTQLPQEMLEISWEISYIYWRKLFWEKKLYINWFSFLELQAVLR